MKPSKSKSRFIAGYILEGMLMQLRNCLELNALCRNPPALTTKLLYELGLSDYGVRSFWRVLRRFINEGHNSIVLLRHGNVEFRIEVDVKKGGVCYIYPNAYMDIYDCVEYRGRARLISNSNNLYLYVTGLVDGEVFIKMNAIFLLKKLIDMCGGKVAEDLVGAARKLIEGDFNVLDLQLINNVFITLMRFDREFKELRIRLPRNEGELVNLVPALRKFLKYMEIT